MNILQVYCTDMWEDLENFETAEEAIKRFEELKEARKDYKGRYRLLLSEDFLRTLSAKQMRGFEIPKEADFIGVIWRPYGDEYYYRLPDGTYGYEYFSIGD